MQCKQFKKGGSPGVGAIQQQERGDCGVLPLLREQHRTDATRSVPRPRHTQTGASRSVPRLRNGASGQARTQARLHLLVRGSHRHAGTWEPRHEPQAARLSWPASEEGFRRLNYCVHSRLQFHVGKHCVVLRMPDRTDARPARLTKSRFEGLLPLDPSPDLPRKSQADQGPAARPGQDRTADLHGHS